MITSLSKKQLQDYTSKQLNFFFPDHKIVNLAHFDTAVTVALDKLEYCYKYCQLKQYNDGNNTYFNHLYSDHYVMYLWYLANTIWREKFDKDVCNKLYYLNKTLHGLDCMYDTHLPDIFLLFHCVGTMLGKATYSNFFVALQGCTVGSHNGIYPVFDTGVSLTAHSSVIGNCKIGKKVSISAYTNIFETDIPGNRVVYKTQNGEIIIKESNKSYAQGFFNVPIE
ncbi:MAG: hypothetical protein ABIN97_06495 [Ginsengibacter sp.]